MQIRPFLHSDLEAVKEFTDVQIGKGYYSVAELADMQLRSMTETGASASFVLIDPGNNSIEGLRLAFPPGQWAHGKGNRLRPDLWPFALDEAGYFQSLFLSPQVRGQNWGPQLSQRALEVFREQGAKGVVTHCWKESPEDSSLRYLQKVGFEIVTEHPDYWIEVDYVCTRDGKPCRCTAIEMVLSLQCF